MRNNIILTAFLSVTLSVAAFAHEGDVIHVGDEAPNFTATASDGTSVSLSTHKGNVILLGFFATWCQGCVEELPRLDREIVAQHKNEGLVVIEVGRGATASELDGFKRRNNFSFMILEDPRRETYTKYATAYIPRFYLIGKDGRVKFTVTGSGDSDFAELKRRVAQELLSPTARN